MEIKGDRRGLRLIARHFESNEVFVDDLRHTLVQQERFLGQAALLIEVPAAALTPELFGQISDVFREFPNLSLRGVQKSDTSGIVTLDQRSAELTAPPKVVRHTLRSGQRVSHPGDLIIIGDVNPGATVTAGGDIMIFGWLRGTVYAGQPDDSTRTIYALRFDPSQIRIAQTMALGNPDGSGNPEKALIEQDVLVVKPWHDIRLPEAVTHDRTTRFDRFSSATPS
ncbi:MAG: septum site-determining protein MinC [Sulfobacillus acidophilus]|uniref:Probable septum site-determining protein MinC n=1 Tax=Sulfobacillus acidophilus TaxID=53633 RepID=A0A2T2WEF2_9FIRM|nr:MAG: septum site-determining protein MinC [Sulfobacillus acidophilus]